MREGKRQEGGKKENWKGKICFYIENYLKFNLWNRYKNITIFPYIFSTDITGLNLIDSKLHTISDLPHNIKLINYHKAIHNYESIIKTATKNEMWDVAGFGLTFQSCIVRSTYKISLVLVLPE